MKTANLLNKFNAMGLWLTALLPLVFVPSLFFPFITAKNILFRIITEVIFISYLLMIAANKKIRPRFSAIFSVLLAFTLLTGLAGLLGVNPARSFFSNFERMEGWVTFIHLLAWFTVAVGTFQERRQWESFFKFNLVVSAIVTGFGLLQVTHLLAAAQDRIGATLGNPIYLSYYMYFNIFICAYFLFSRKKMDMPSMGYSALALLQIFIMVRTATRGVIVGFLFGIVIAALFLVKFGEKKSWQRRLALALLLIVAGTVTVIYSFANSTFIRNNPLVNRFAHVSIKDMGSDTERIIVWKMAWQGIKQRPLLGWGQENFAVVFSKYYDPRLAGHEEWYDRTHNTYLEWWLAAGILGLLAYLGIFAAAFYTIGKADPTSLSLAEKSIWLGLLAGYLVINIFDFDNLISYLAFFSVLGFLHTLRKNEGELPEKPEPKRRPSPLLLRSALTSLILIAGAAAMVALHGPSMRSLYAVSQALSSQPEGFAKNLDYFREALNYKTIDREEILRQLIDSAVQISMSDNAAIGEPIKKAFFEATCAEMGKMTAAGPVSARLEAAYSFFLNRYGRFTEALTHLQKANQLFPNKPTILLERTVALLSLQRYDDALATAREAFDLNPGFQESRKIYALCAICAGKQQLAESLLLPFYHTAAPDDDQFILAYSLTRQWPKVIQIYSNRLAKNPYDLDNRVRLAEVFMRSGDKQKAVEQIELAISYNPSFQEHGLSIIQKISSFEAKGN
jgi:O-antigen ligase